MLYCAYRLSMPWRRYLEEHDPLDHYVWWEWFKLHEWDEPRWKQKDPYECIVGDGPDANVSQATWDRWQGKVAQAGQRLMMRDEILKKFARKGDEEAKRQLRAKGIKEW